MNDDLTAASGAYFLSYSRSDESFALRLAADIRARGISLWVDQLDIRPSEHWDRAIERAVRACRGIVVLLSPRSVASENVADEISFALNDGKRVLPVMIETCPLPLRITRMQVIDATRDYAPALDQCLAELRRDGSTVTYSEAVGPMPTAGIQRENLEAAARILAQFLGPIAPMLVRRESKGATTAEELGYRLAQLIPKQSERDEFLSQLNGKSPG